MNTNPLSKEQKQEIESILLDNIASFEEIIEKIYKASIDKKHKIKLDLLVMKLETYEDSLMDIYTKFQALKTSIHTDTRVDVFHNAYLILKYLDFISMDAVELYYSLQSDIPGGGFGMRRQYEELDPILH